MPCYMISKNTNSLTELERHRFQSEGGHDNSPQVLVSSYPQLVFDIPEIDVQNDDTPLICREFSTNRGAIDILMITSNADIIIIETKLLRNPESHRQVVAQVIDYAKAFASESLSSIIKTLTRNKYSDKNLLKNFRAEDFWLPTLEKNIRTANFQLIILGDIIHPNVLGMVESIQSAPHLSFTIHLVELDPFIDSVGNLYLRPRAIAKTNEIERSVIKISIDYENKSYQIDSEIPQEGGKGQKPVITKEQFIDNVSKQEFVQIIKKFWSEWDALGNDIRFGGRGFSCGIIYGEKRIPLTYVYDNYLSIISPKTVKKYEIPEDIFQIYREYLKQSKTVYDGFVVGGKIDVQYDLIDSEDLKIIFDSTVKIAKKLSED